LTIDAQILYALREAGSAGVSGAELAQKLGISRAAIWARIEDLRALGYQIEATPHHGYHLLSVPDVLHADDLLSRLSTRIVGRHIQVFQETGSTNDIIEKLARDGVREGAVIFAESQTKGRGRLGRRWLSPPKKGLWFSVLLCPKLRPQAATQFTIAAATALSRAIHIQTGLTPEIKWPNDILIRGRKTAGILTELNAELDSIKYLILGIGLDVNLDPSDFPKDLRATATSLKIETGHTVDRAGLAAEILIQLDDNYHRLRGGHFEAIANEWESQCITIGQNVWVDNGNQKIQGQVESLDSDGALLLRTQYGRLERILGGDITFEKTSSSGP
jgi:BirA family transcriptional regulator, biotin operon repressor / biotin---[acetyl-CoA-carboxylase] ligase